MTHSLHRKGTEEELKSDYVFLGMRAADIHDKTPELKKLAKTKMVRFGEILSQHNPTSIMMDRLWQFSPAVTAAFDNIGVVKEVLQFLIQEDLGISVVLSGLTAEIQKLAKELELKPHSIHLSLGVFGKKDLLPPEELLEITTMCGHHCVSPQSIEHKVAQIKKGKVTVEEAAQDLAKPCVCGIVNPTRVTQVLRKLL